MSEPLEWLLGLKGLKGAAKQSQSQKDLEWSGYQHALKN